MHPHRYKVVEIDLKKKEVSPVVYFVVVIRYVFSHRSRYILLWSICGSFLFPENPPKKLNWIVNSCAQVCIELVVSAHICIEFNCMSMPSRHQNSYIKAAAASVYDIDALWRSQRTKRLIFFASDV